MRFDDAGTAQAVTAAQRSKSAARGKADARRRNAVASSRDPLIIDLGDTAGDNGQIGAWYAVPVPLTQQAMHDARKAAKKAAKAAAKKGKKARKTPAVTHGLSDSEVTKLAGTAQELLAADVERFAAVREESMGSEGKWMQTVLKTGTLSDKVAALALLVQEAPVHSMRCGGHCTLLTMECPPPDLLSLSPLASLGHLSHAAGT